MVSAISRNHYEILMTKCAFQKNRQPLPLLEPLFILQVQERESTKYSAFFYLGSKKVYQKAVFGIFPLSQARKLSISKKEGKAPMFK